MAEFAKPQKPRQGALTARRAEQKIAAARLALEGPSPRPQLDSFAVPTCAIHREREMEAQAPSKKPSTGPWVMEPLPQRAKAERRRPVDLSHPTASRLFVRHTEPARALENRENSVDPRTVARACHREGLTEPRVNCIPMRAHFRRDGENDVLERHGARVTRPRAIRQHWARDLCQKRQNVASEQIDLLWTSPIPEHHDEGLDADCLACPQTLRDLLR